MSEKKGISRLVSLLIRSLKDVEIFFSAFAFAFKYSSKNKITDLFQFRKAIEIEQVSPFRSMVKNFRAGKSVNLQLPQFGNAKIEFHLDDYFQMAICEEFIKYKIYDLSLLKFTPDVSIDCGTYRGYFSFLIHEQFKNCKIVCIEPHPENYKSLMKSVSENSIENVVAFNNALSTKQGSIELELWGSNMSKNDANQNSPNLVSVATIDLFEILKSMKQSEKLMLKMDIEGGELEYFPDCISQLPQTCAVFLETHDGWDSLKNIQQQFIENDFAFQVIRDRGLYIDIFAQRIAATS